MDDSSNEEIGVNIIGLYVIDIVFKSQQILNSTNADTSMIKDNG
jgi:hypothetical protein